MENREIILFGVGFLLGYMVLGATKNKNIVAPKNQSSLDTFTETIPPKITGAVNGQTQIQEPEIVETVNYPKVSFCKEKWIKFAETRKFGSEEQEQQVYNNFMTSCVAQS